MTEKARISNIQLGSFLIEGLMLPDGSFAIGVSQIAQILPNLISPTNETRSVKRLLGKQSQLVRTKSELHPKAVNIISLNEFEELLVEATARGDEDAKALTKALIGTTLHKLWCVAFDQKFDDEMFVQFLASRHEHLKKFHERLTTWWKQDGCESGDDYKKRVIDFKRACHLPEFQSVDQYSTELLRIINAKEIEYCAYRKAGLDHDRAISLM